MDLGPMRSCLLWDKYKQSLACVYSRNSVIPAEEATRRKRLMASDVENHFVPTVNNAHDGLSMYNIFLLV